MNKKIDYSLAPPEFDDIILPLQHSAETGKYGRNDWLIGKNFNKEQNYSSVRRHWAAYYGGQKIDPDSGLPHLLMASLRGMMQYTIDKRNEEYINQGFKAWTDLPKCDKELQDDFERASLEDLDNYIKEKGNGKILMGDGGLLDELFKLRQTTEQYEIHPQHCFCKECRDNFNGDSQ